MTLKLSRAGTLRPQAEAQVDLHFASQINAILGPLAAVHMLKRQGFLVDGDADAVAARAAEQDTALALLDRRRRDMKARVRAAGTAAEIKAILAELS